MYFLQVQVKAYLELWKLLTMYEYEPVLSVLVHSLSMVHTILIISIFAVFSLILLIKRTIVLYMYSSLSLFSD